MQGGRMELTVRIMIPKWFYREKKYFENLIKLMSNLTSLLEKIQAKWLGLQWIMDLH